MDEVIQVRVPGFGWRVLACLVDLLIILLITSAVFATIQMFFTVDSPTFLLYQELMMAAIFLLREGSTGGSPGKQLFRMRLVDAKTLRPVGMGRGILRNVTLVIPCVPLVELVVMLFNDRRQRLGNMLAGTVVIWKRDLPAA